MGFVESVSYVSLHPLNRPFVASHSRVTKPPYWRATDTQGQGKLRARIIQNDSGSSRGGAPLFLYQTEARRAKKNFLEIAPHPPPPPLLALYQGLDDGTPAPLSHGLDPALNDSRLYSLSCSSASLALQYGGLVQCERLWLQRAYYSLTSLLCHFV